MSAFELPTPTGKTGCVICGDEFAYHTMSDLLNVGISGIGGAPDKCKHCKAVEALLVTELSNKIRRECEDCGWGSNDNPTPGTLPSGRKCGNCRGKGYVGTITEAQFRARLVKRVKTIRHQR